MSSLNLLNLVVFHIGWPGAIGLAYVAALIAGIILSFTMRRQPRRRTIRIVTIALATPILLILALLIFLRFTLFREPPTLAELKRDFPSKRADLETILAMSDDDANFSRIAPDFVDGAPEPPNVIGRHMADDPNAGLPKARWDAYRKVYARNGIKLGIQRNDAHDAFIMVDSVGFLDSGHTTGYLHCAPGTSAASYRFEPCVLRQESGKREFDPKGVSEAYSFQKLDDRWYAYDWGP
jgi:hypothetical protein